MLLSLFIQPEELEELIRLDNLNFNSGSATILPSSYASLNEFINYVEARKILVIAFANTLIETVKDSRHQERIKKAFEEVFYAGHQ